MVSYQTVRVTPCIVLANRCCDFKCKPRLPGLFEKLVTPRNGIELTIVFVLIHPGYRLQIPLNMIIQESSQL